MKLRILLGLFLLVAALTAASIRTSILASRRASPPSEPALPPPPVAKTNPVRFCTKTFQERFCTEVEIEIVDEDEEAEAGRILEGRAVDAKGRALADVPVVIRVRERTYAVVTETDGTFRLEACEGPVAALAYNRYPARVVGSDYVFDSFGE